MNLNNLLGQKFDRLTVLKRNGTDANRRAVWTCRCDCGTVVDVNSWKLKRRVKKSCGCLYRESVRRKDAKYRKHGLYNHRVYDIWWGMRSRCRRSQKIRLDDPRWLDFKTFLLDMGMPPEGQTIARVNTKLGFSKSNCRWEPIRRAQSINSCRTVTYQGKTRTTIEWAAHFNMRHKIFSRRIWSGWSVEKAGTTPVAKRNKRPKRPELPLGDHQFKNLYQFEYQHK